MSERCALLLRKGHSNSYCKDTCMRCNVRALLFVCTSFAYLETVPTSLHVPQIQRRHPAPNTNIITDDRQNNVVVRLYNSTAYLDDAGAGRNA